MNLLLALPLVLASGCIFDPPADSAADEPAPVETCNGKDDDGDGEIDEDVADLPAWYADDDADGYGDPTDTTSGCEAPGGFIADNTDCNDADALVNPGAEEKGANEVDENCDDYVDPTCGGHAPVIDTGEGSFDANYDFHTEVGPAMLIDVHFTDADGDVGTIQIRGWVDPEVDGVVDTTGDASFTFDWIDLDDDSTCGVAENSILITLGASNLVDKHPSAEVAMEVSDALEHWSEPKVVEVPLE